MAKYRAKLPQLGGSVFLTDGGIETSLIFLDGIELPYFAAFDLLKSPEGRSALRKYYSPYAQLAKNRNMGFVLESPTWRASADWGKKLGYGRGALARINSDAIALMADLRAQYETPHSPMVISDVSGRAATAMTPAR